MDRRLSLKRFGLAALILTGLPNIAESQTPNAISPEFEIQIQDQQPQVFSHPTLGYTLAVPPGGKVFERQDGSSQISIRSRKGYKITVQAGASRHQIPLSRLSAVIEEKYFGRGKPWRYRLDDRATQVAGLSAYEVNYEGPNNRSQVVFVRGRKLDYVFIFLSGPRQYSRFVHEFEWVLKNFKPAKGEVTENSTQFQTRAQRFSRPEFGYSMLYPADWEQSEPAKMTMMFGGPVGTPAYTSIVSVQNIEPPGAANSEDALKRAVSDLKTSLGRSVPGIKFTVDQPWTYSRADLKLQGRELNATYTYAGQVFRKVMFVVPRPFQTVAHVWSYTAPEKDFLTFQPLAEQILKSWVITGVNRG